MLHNKKIFILGMARSGFEVAKLVAPDNTILITDMQEASGSDLKVLNELNVTFVCSSNQEELLDETFDLVIKNPGISEDVEVIKKAKTLGIPVLNELEVSFHYLPNSVNLISVTGSNGKTTTTILIYEMLKKDNLRTFVGGNIGIPLASFVKDCKPGDFVVLEVSDHQLKNTLEFNSHVTVLTNIFPVHLDFHGDYETYKNTKKKIFMNQSKYDVAIINKDNEEAVNLTKDIKGIKKYFSLQSKSDAYYENGVLYYNGNEIMATKDIKLIGNHNLENILAAICAVKEYGVSDEAIRSVLSSFKGVPHRIEYVANFYNVAFYNDSKSTNCEATITALSSFKTPVILILGGLDRGHSFEPLKPYLNNVKFIAAIGETKERIKKFCDQEHIACETYNTLKEAVMASYAKAVAYDTILLSPACASWDMYPSFEVRGDEFKSIVKSLESEE